MFVEYRVEIVVVTSWISRKEDVGNRFSVKSMIVIYYFYIRIFLRARPNESRTKSLDHFTIWSTFNDSHFSTSLTTCLSIKIIGTISNTSIGVKTILPRVDPAFLPVLNYDKTSFDFLVWKGNATGNHKLPERWLLSLSGVGVSEVCYTRYFSLWNLR